MRRNLILFAVALVACSIPSDAMSLDEGPASLAGLEAPFGCGSFGGYAIASNFTPAEVDYLRAGVAEWSAENSFPISLKSGDRSYCAIQRGTKMNDITTNSTIQRMKLSFGPDCSESCWKSVVKVGMTRLRD